MKLAASLRFFAEWRYQKRIGMEYGVGLSQSAFSAILEEMIDRFEKSLCLLWIKWMSIEEMKSAAFKFYDKFKIPSVMWCIDGTHIKIVGSKHNNLSLFVTKKLDKDLLMRCIQELFTIL